MAERPEAEQIETIPERLANVKERINRACDEAGRSSEDVTLIAVSKFHSPLAVSAAIQAGQRHFAENRVQELLAKQADLQELNPDVASQADWHLIGSLQRNKVRKVLGKVSLIQSVDRPSLLEEINRIVMQRELPAAQDVLLEINYSRESSKQGWPPDAVNELLEAARQQPGIRVRGLMTMAEFGLDADSQLAFFSQVRRGWESIRGSLPDDEQADFDILSMGMSGDFEAAVASGSTMVRVGTAIFGPRA